MEQFHQEGVTRPPKEKGREIKCQLNGTTEETDK